jgi:peptidoglycan/xylan/chitin deacetylase (PgdA/CDA1 family)
MSENPQQTNGAFVISLDFELYWGILDKHSLVDRKQYFLDTREKAIPGILSLFRQYRIHATWATVGMLFCDGREQLQATLPSIKPNYTNPRLSSYEYIKTNPLGRSEQEDPYHFAPSLIKIIASHEGQEIGSHSFSHYYCLEQGQSQQSFRADLESARLVAQNLNIQLSSLVFPRNQFNNEYLKICMDQGFKQIRSNEPSWVWNIGNSKSEGAVKRSIRYMDSYVNLFGRNAYSTIDRSFSSLACLPASRFLRPFNPKAASFEKLKMARILADLDLAAQSKAYYHLWWHPHNFGFHTAQNLGNLEVILDHVAKLREKYDFQSFNLAECNRIWSTPSRHV